jgi:hypothetical protein
MAFWVTAPHTPTELRNRRSNYTSACWLCVANTLNKAVGEVADISRRSRSIYQKRRENESAVRITFRNGFVCDSFYDALIPQII